MTQGTVLGSLLFLIYINDLPVGLTTNVKLFVDDTSLFSFVNNASVSASRLNSDLVKIGNWVFNWEMSFNPDHTKQAKEVIFSKKKIIPATHPSLFFNNSLIEQDTTQKHLTLTLDHKLTFRCHVKEKIKKRHGRDWSSSKTTIYFTSNNLTDYLQIVYETTFGLR